MHAFSFHRRLWKHWGMWIMAGVVSRQTRALMGRCTGTTSGMRCGCANVQPNCFRRQDFLRQDESSFSLRSLFTTNQKEFENMTGWTVQDTLERSQSFLVTADAPEPESSVIHLLAYALGLSWETGFVQLRHVSSDDALSKRILSSNEASLFSNMLERRVKKEPLQYILGKWDFLDYTFQIRPSLLCPRPETEELVLKVVEDTKRLSGTVRILDIGCGTGAIGVSLAALLRDSQVVAIDIEPVAISTSNENALIILGDCNRYQAMLCSADAFVNDGAAFDVIVSNPPYIPEHDMETLSDDVVRYESRQALCGGTDGMDVVREVILHSPQWSRPGGVIWMEVDPTHPKLLREWVDSEALGVAFDSVHQDLYGRDRFVKLKVV